MLTIAQITDLHVTTRDDPLNHARNDAMYPNDPLAPSRYRPDALFATRNSGERRASAFFAGSSDGNGLSVTAINGWAMISSARGRACSSRHCSLGSAERWWC